MDEEPDEALATLIDQAKQSNPIQELKCKLCPKTFTGVNMLIATLLHLNTEHDGFFESQQNSISSSSEVEPSQLLSNENMDVSSSNMDSLGELAVSAKCTTQADTTFKEMVTTYENKKTQTECDKELKTECDTISVATETGFTEILPVPDPMKRFLCLCDKLGTCQPYHCLICGTYKSNLKTAVIHLVQKHNVPLRRQRFRNKSENLSSVSPRRIGRDRQTARKSVNSPSEKVVTEPRRDSSTGSLHSEKLASTIAKLHKPSKPAPPLVTPHLMANKRSVRAVSADIVTLRADPLSKAAHRTLNLSGKKTPSKSRENSTSSFHLSTKKKREAFKESIKENSRKNKKRFAGKRRCATNKTFQKNSLMQTRSPSSDETFAEAKTAKCTDPWKNLTYNSTKDRNAKPESDCDTTDSENNLKTNTFRPGSSKPCPTTKVTTTEVQHASKVTRTQSAPDVSRAFHVSNRKVRNTARKSTRPNKPPSLPLEMQGLHDRGLGKFITFDKPTAVSSLKTDCLSSLNMVSHSIDSEQEASSSTLPPPSTPTASSSFTAVSIIKKRPTSRKSIRSTT